MMMMMLLPLLRDPPHRGCDDSSMGCFTRACTLLRSSPARTPPTTVPPRRRAQRPSPETTRLRAGTFCFRFRVLLNFGCFSQGFITAPLVANSSYIFTSLPNPNCFDCTDTRWWQ
jgi:hypothetical protein